MDNEDLMRRIQELEVENQKLKKALYKEPVDKPPFPLYHREKYKPVFQCQGDAAGKVSYVVRAICFRTLTKPRKNRFGKVLDTDFVIRTTDMNDEEYKAYLEIMDEIFDLLTKRAYSSPKKKRAFAGDCPGAPELITAEEVKTWAE